MKHTTGVGVARMGLVLAVALLFTLAGQGVQAAQLTLGEDGPIPGGGSGKLAPSSMLISYQGTLTDPSGNPIDATVSMEFALYNAPNGGTLVWGPEPQTVQIANGLFNVLLGSVTAIDPADLGGDLWLGIRVNDEDLVPREQITSIAYAAEAGTLPDGARTSGKLMVQGSLFVLSPDSDIHEIQMWRTDEEDRVHKWAFWHMNQQYGMNSLQIYEYRTDSNGVDCGGDPANGAICAPRFTISQGGNIGIGTTNPGAKLEIAATEGHALIASGPVGLWGAVGVHDNLYLDGNLAAASDISALGNIASAGNVTAEGSLAVNGSGFFGGATYNEGAMNLQHYAVPLTFRESDASGQGSLWRMPLDETRMRFDSSDNGLDFTSYHTPLWLFKDGSIGCGALTENNLQTPEEQAAGRSDRFEEGDVLCWGIAQLEKCSIANDRLVQAVADKSGRPIVIGAEVVKVLGPVKRGDILVASDVPGYATVNNDPMSGSVIAQALEDFDGERGIIKAMIRKW